MDKPIHPIHGKGKIVPDLESRCGPGEVLFKPDNSDDWLVSYIVKRQHLFNVVKEEVKEK